MGARRGRRRRRPRSFDDLEQDAAILLRAARPDEGAQRPRNATAASDYAPEVVRGDPEAKDEIAVLLVLVDANLFGFLDQPARQVLDELGGGGDAFGVTTSPRTNLDSFAVGFVLGFVSQAMFFAFSSRETASEGCAPFESQSFTFASSNSIS